MADPKEHLSDLLDDLHVLEHDGSMEAAREKREEIERHFARHALGASDVRSAELPPPARKKAKLVRLKCGYRESTPAGVTACPPGHCRTPSAPCRGACIQTIQPRDTADVPRPATGVRGTCAACGVGRERLQLYMRDGVPQVRKTCDHCHAHLYGDAEGDANLEAVKNALGVDQPDGGDKC